jgi:hypothetical protein
MADKPLDLERLKAIKTDPDFLKFVAQHRDMLTKKVMAQSTLDDKRLAALTEFHALDSIVNAMGRAVEHLKD